MTISENIIVSSKLGGEWSEKMRETDARYAEFDKEWPTFHDVRVRLQTLFMNFDPIIYREFKPMLDSWYFDVFVKINGRKARFSVEVPNLTEDPSINADEVVDSFKALYIEYLKGNYIVRT